MATSVASPAASAPPPPSAAPSAPAPAASVYDQIGSALETPNETPADSAPTPANEPPAQEAAPEVLAAAETPKVEAGTAEPDPYADDVPAAPDATAPEMAALLATPQGRELVAARNLLNELAKPREQGGIGHKPTLQQMRDYHGAFYDRMLMEQDLASGKPEQIGRYFLDYVFGPSRGPAVTQIANNLAPVLAQRPELYAAVAEPFLQRYQTALLDRFNDTPDGNADLRNALWFTASIINNDLTGKYLPSIPEGQPLKWKPEYLNGTGAQTNGAPDPLAEERRTLAAERAQIQQMRQQDAQKFEREWVGNVNTQIGTSLNSELDRALAPLKKAYEGKPRAYEALRKEFHDTVKQSLPQNQDTWAIFQAAFAQAKAAGTKEAAQQVAQEYHRLAQQYIIANRRKFMEEAGVALASQSAAQHAGHQAIASHGSTVNGSNGALPPNPGEAIKQQPGETTADFILRQIKAAAR